MKKKNLTITPPSISRTGIKATPALGVRCVLAPMRILFQSDQTSQNHHPSHYFDILSIRQFTVQIFVAHSQVIQATNLACNPSIREAYSSKYGEINCNISLGPQSAHKNSCFDSPLQFSHSELFRYLSSESACRESSSSKYDSDNEIRPTTAPGNNSKIILLTQTFETDLGKNVSIWTSIDKYGAAKLGKTEIDIKLPEFPGLGMNKQFPWDSEHGEEEASIFNATSASYTHIYIALPAFSKHHEITDAILRSLSEQSEPHGAEAEIPFRGRFNSGLRFY